MAGVFPSVLKTAKVVPGFKKYSKLDYSDYRPIFLLSHTEKILEKLMYKTTRIMLSITYCLNSDNSILYLMP